MAVNPTRLKSTLNQTKTQRDNNALYQTLNGIIDGLKEILGNFLTIAAFNAYNSQVRYITIVEIDTSTIAPTLLLTDYVFNNFYVFKDISGNAAANNITFTGTVEGTVNPVVNTNYGIFRIYRSLNDGLYYQW